METRFDTLTFNGAIFHYDGQNLQAQATDPSVGITRTINVGSSNLTGVDLDLDWRATREWTFGASASYIDSEFTSFPNGLINVPCTFSSTEPDCAVNGGTVGVLSVPADLKGNELPLTPEWSGNVRVTYAHDLANNMGTVHAGVVVAYKGDHFFTIDNVYKQDAYTLLSGSVGWTSPGGNWDITAYGSNLTDEEYLTHVAPFAIGGWLNRGAPRTYGLRVSFDY